MLFFTGSVIHGSGPKQPPMTGAGRSSALHAGQRHHIGGWYLPHMYDFAGGRLPGVDCLGRSLRCGECQVSLPLMCDALDDDVALRVSHDLGGRVGLEPRPRDYSPCSDRLSYRPSALTYGWPEYRMPGSPMSYRERPLR